MVPPKCPEAAVAMLGLLPLIGVRLCFLGTAFLELGHQYSGPPPAGRLDFQGGRMGSCYCLGSWLSEAYGHEEAIQVSCS